MTAKDTEVRPLRADARRNRAKVLEAAQEAFAAEGPNVALDEIARRAGVGAGTVYRHFPTKEALLEAVVADRIRVLIDATRVAAEADDPEKAFYDYFRALIADAGAKLDLSDALSRAGVEIGETARAMAAELHEAINELLQRAQAVGAVRMDANVEDLHALIVGAVAAERRSGTVGGTGRATQLMCDALRPRS